MAATATATATAPVRAAVTAPAVLVLASGQGARFRASGGAGSKLQALLAGRPVIEHTLAAVWDSGLPFHVEQGPHAGMGDCIAAAVGATAQANGWLVLPGDLPLVRPATLLTVAQALADGQVVVPVHQGRRGHPVGFPVHLRQALTALQGPQGAASIVASQPALLLELDDEGIATDIDTVADLAAAERLFRRRSAPT